jgi:hypothetical protein
MSGWKVDGTTYRKMVGNLIYLVNTKLDIKISMSTNQFLIDPQLLHLNAVKQIIWYWKGITYYGILYWR